MARYEHLPIYKAALDMTVHFEKLVAGFSRYHKYTLGTELREASRRVLMQVLHANHAGARDQRAYFCARSLELLGQSGLLQHAVGGVARKDFVVDREARPAAR